MQTQSFARIYLNNKPHGADAPWPLQISKAKQLAVNGNKVEVHSPQYPGIDYCRQCGVQAVKPYLYVSEYSEFWRCKCGKMNYITQRT